MFTIFKKPSCLLSASLLLAAINAQAIEHDYYLSFFTGVNWESSGQTVLTNFGDLNTNQYAANTDYQPALWSGIGAGYRWLFPRHKLWLDLGGEISYTSLLSPSGTVHPLYLIDPSADTLNFNYNISSLPILAVTHLGYELNRWFNPYLVVGLGFSVNRAYNYNEVPSNPDLSASPMRSMFSANKQVDFAYSAGLGFNIEVKKFARSLGIEYRYSNFGEANFNATPGQATNDGLSLGSISSHALLLSLTI